MKEFSASSGQALPELDATAYPPGAIPLPVEFAPGTEGIITNDLGEAFTRLGIRLLVPSLTNRNRFDKELLKAMAETIKARGVRHPLIVRPLPGSRLQETRINTPKGQPLPTHEIVCGERRWLASALAGLATVPVIVRDLTDEQALEEQVTENVVREGYTALEEGEAFQRLMQHNKLTADEVAAKVTKSRRHVYNRIKLLDLRSETRASLEKGDIDATRALLLARIPDHEQQILALASVAKRDYQGEFEMSVRDAEKYVQREFMLNLSSAKFKITDLTLVPEAGSCKACPKRTGHNPDLFADVKGADVCTDAPCFHRKEEAHNNRILQQAHAHGQEVITGREAKALMPNSWGGVEGYLRLDDAKDSPTDKPLRKLIGNQLEKDEIKPTLVENPHKKGEMIAVLPATKVAELLKARGHKEAASSIDADTKKAEKAKADEEKGRLGIKYEQSWRDQVLLRTWEAIQLANFGGGTSLSEGILRYIARHLANTANAERTRQLCKLLDLGKIAPKDALLEHIKACAQPEHVLLLLIMHQDAEYKHWTDDPVSGNAGLLQIAADFKVDIETVKADAKKDMKVQLGTKTVPPADPSLPELRSRGGAGGKPGTARPAGAPRKQKISADEATLGIAVAMQQMEKGAVVASGHNPQSAWPFPGFNADGSPAPKAKAAAATSFTVGQRVRVTTDDGKLRMKHDKYAGREGVVKGLDIGGKEWDVTFKAPNRGTRCFEPGELEVAA